ncbi:MAG: hypothetical protein EBR82_78610 [Caulobacteraceae bacterium]|nr:hypothetical protein [Caulobacteraceae bacterium]
MCDEVKIDGQWCETIGQLRRALLPIANIVKSRNYNALPPDDACLCGVDICATLIQSRREDYDHEPGSGRWVVLEEPVAPTSGRLLRSTKIGNKRG